MIRFFASVLIDQFNARSDWAENFASLTVTTMREQEWHSGESTRLTPVWPGFDSQTRRHMWVESVGSLHCSERFFSGTPVFPSPQKNQCLI